MASVRHSSDDWTELMGTLRPHGIHCTVQRGVQTVGITCQSDLALPLSVYFFSPFHPLPLLSVTSSPKTAHSSSREVLTPTLFLQSEGVMQWKKKWGGGKRAAFEQRINKTSLKSERDFADWLTWHSEEEEAEGAREKNTKQERRERYKREGSTSLWLSHSAFMFPTGSHFSSAAPGSTDDLILMFHLASAVIHVGFFFFFRHSSLSDPLKLMAPRQWLIIIPPSVFVEASS